MAVQGRFRLSVRATLVSSLLLLLLLAIASSCSSQQPGGSVAGSVSASAKAGEATAQRNLSEDEARGGHTLSRHVGKSDEELHERLRRERISAASTYTDVVTAEQTVGSTLQRESARVRAWAERSGRRPNLALDFTGDSGHPIGRTMRRGETKSRPCANAVVVLKSDGANGYYVLTSYPECR